MAFERSMRTAAIALIAPLMLFACSSIQPGCGLLNEKGALSDVTGWKPNDRGICYAEITYQNVAGKVMAPQIRARFLDKTGNTISEQLFTFNSIDPGKSQKLHMPIFCNNQVFDVMEIMDAHEVRPGALIGICGLSGQRFTFTYRN